jgi:PAS domain S-box-containing protein
MNGKEATDAGSPHMDELRRQAEQRARTMKATPAEAMTRTDFCALVHELQVHQIELEMQNEEVVRAQAAAEELSEKYFDLFDFAPIGYFLWDVQGRILEVNLAGAALLGLERNAVIQKRFGQFVALEDRLAFTEFCKQAVEADAKKRCEVKLRIGNHSIHVLIAGSTVRDRREKQRRCRAAVMDVTDRKEAEEEHHRLQQQLAHVARLATMGEMVAGIAHEVNQPLHSIATFAKACSNVLARDHVQLDQLREWNQAIAVAARRGAEIIKRLRVFLGKTEGEFTPTPIRQVIEESLSLVAFEIRDRQITVDKQIDALDLMVGIERVQVQQVLINLLQNACEALDETMDRSRQVPPPRSFSTNTPTTVPDASLPIFACSA